MRYLIFAIVVFVFSSTDLLAQPRPAETASNAGKQAPPTFKAKYEGGLFGYSKKIDGTLNFDDDNERLVFRDKDKKEMFSLTYESLLTVYPNSQSVTSTTGNVVRNLPLPGAGLAGFIKEKRRYIVMQFNDQDADVRGTVSFKIDDKELLDSAIQTIGRKAKMTQRGDSYYRPRQMRTTTNPI